MKRSSPLLLAFCVLILVSSATLFDPSASHAASGHATAQHKPITIFPARGQLQKQHGAVDPKAVYGSGDLVYHGGNVENSPQVYLIFWGPGWSNSSPDVQLITQYFHDVGGTSFENILTQYYGSAYAMPIANTLTLGGVWMDGSTPPTDHTCGSHTIQDSAIQQEVNKAVSTNGWSSAFGAATFFVYTPNGYAINDGFNECSEQIFCGYHNYIASPQGHAYAAVPYPSNLPGCGVPTSPNGDIYGDSLVNISSHEQFEGITDPDVASGWYDQLGYEVADKCDFDFSSGLTSLNNGGVFLVQTEYSNVSSSCVNTFTAGAFMRTDQPTINAVLLPGQSWTQPMNLSNSGTAPMNWTAGALPSWVSVTPSSGALSPHSAQPLTIVLTAPNSMTQTYTTNLTLSAANTVNAPFSIPITMEIANVSRQWYFAEGYTGGGFSEFLTLANTSGYYAHVQVKYLLGSGMPIIKTYLVNPSARYTVNVNNEIGPNQNVSMVVTADEPIVAERPTYFTFTGLAGYSIPGGSDVLGATSLSQNFDFGYLDTTPGHATFLTILNQNASPLTATIQYFAASGSAPKPIQHTVPANSRGTVDVNAEGLAPGTYSALVNLSAPGLVERPLYLKDGTTGYTGSADVVGVATPLTDWYFAEGYTGSTFAERYILSNPNTSGVANATVTFFRSSGAPLTANVSLQPGEQKIVDANALLGLNVNNSAHVSANLPILAERFISFKYTGVVGSGGSASIPGATDVLGAAAPSNLFYFAEGYTGSTFAEYLTIENPSATSTATVQVSFLTGAYPVPTATFAIPPSTRFTLLTNSVPAAANWSFSMTVESNVPIVAERPMYFTFTGGKTGGSDVVGYQPPGVLPPSGLSVYFAGGGNTDYLYGMDASTGATRWSYLLNGPNNNAPSAVAVANGVAYVSLNVSTLNPPDAVYAIKTSDGSLLWSTPISYPSAPAVSGGVVYLTSATYPGVSYSLYALDANTGAVLWQHQLSGYAGTPVVANGVIYYGSNNHTFYALNASDGSLLWSYQNTGGSFTMPVVANGTVYVGSDDHSFYALNASTGALLWSYQTGAQIYTTPVLANGAVYFSSQDGYVYALNVSDGSLLWRVSATAASLAADQGMIFTSYSGPTGSSAVQAFDASTGVLLWSYQTQYAGPVAAANGAVYFSVNGNTPSGYLYVLQESDGSLLWGASSSISTPPTLAP